jgi:hypothetical protein
LCVAGRDALADHRQLVVPEGDVPPNVRVVPPGALGVTGQELRRRQEALLRGHHGHDRGAVLAEPVVDVQQPDVGQRVAERGHLPVHDGDDLVVGVEHDVGQSVVAVHDRRPSLDGHIGLERAADRLLELTRALLRGQRLGVPSLQLPTQEALGSPEVPEPDTLGVHGVESHQGVQQFRADPASGGRVHPGEPRVVEDGAVDEIHHVERGADDVDVGAQNERRRHRYVRTRESRDHPELPRHVVRGGQHVTERRPTQHPGPGSVGDPVCEVGPAAGDQLGA